MEIYFVFNETHIKNLQILIFLLDKQFLVELFNKVNFFVSMKKMIKSFQDGTIFNGQNLQGHMTLRSVKD